MQLSFLMNKANNGAGCDLHVATQGNTNGLSSILNGTRYIVAIQIPNPLKREGSSDYSQFQK